MSFSAASLSAALEAHAPAGATGLVVALSGGADSAGLLSAAAALGRSFRGLPLRAVHVDHGLQAAAAAFREACAADCARLNVPLTVIGAEVRLMPGASIEAAAREARYAALQAQLRPGECLLTAHHCEDQAETLLLQALRGAGLKGLSAMPICRPFGAGWHLRPVLHVPRAELAGAGGVADPMNQDRRFDRSYLRGAVWPLIETRWPGAARALARTAHHAAQAQSVLDDIAAADVARLRDGDALSVPGLRTLEPAARLHALRYWLWEAGVEPPSTARLSEALRQMLEAQSDHSPAMHWGDHALRRYRQRVFLTAARPPRLEGVRQWTVRRGAAVDLGPGLGTLRWVAQAGGIDVSRLGSAVVVRRRQGGECLRPAVRAKTHSVQHLCQSLGVLPWLRDALPLVFAPQGLIAVADLWLETRRCAAAGEPGLGVAWDEAPIIV